MCFLKKKLRFLLFKCIRKERWLHSNSNPKKPYTKGLLFWSHTPITANSFFSQELPVKSNACQCMRERWREKKTKKQKWDTERKPEREGSLKESSRWSKALDGLNRAGWETHAQRCISVQFCGSGKVEQPKQSEGRQMDRLVVQIKEHAVTHCITLLRTYWAAWNNNVSTISYRESKQPRKVPENQSENFNGLFSRADPSHKLGAQDTQKTLTRSDA